MEKTPGTHTIPFEFVPWFPRAGPPVQITVQPTRCSAILLTKTCSWMSHELCAASPSSLFLKMFHIHCPDGILKSHQRKGVMMKLTLRCIMGTLCLAGILLLPAAHSAPKPKPLPASRPAFLTPGGAWRLTVESKVTVTTRPSTTSSKEAMNADGTSTTIKEKETVEPPVTTIHSGQEAARIQAAPAVVDGKLKLTASVIKKTAGKSSPRGKRAYTVYDAAKPGDSRPAQAYKNVSFLATVNKAGQLSNLELPTGDFWMKLWQKMDIEKHKKRMKSLKPPFNRRMPYGQSGYNIFDSWTSLESVMAYWPPAKLRVGQQWSVQRDGVFPYQGFLFSMLTRGGAMSEESVCEVMSIESTQEQQIATIKITGKRTVISPQGKPPTRISKIALDGTMKVNLTTQSVDSLQTKWIPTFKDPKDQKHMQLEAIETITLKPVPAKKAKK